jgi:hypothetical protein
MSDARDEPLTVEDLRTVEGVAREAGRAPCPACGRALLAGQEVVTALGDVRRGAVGVTVHRRCFAAIGPVGLLEMMVAAYRRGTQAG